MRTALSVIALLAPFLSVAHGQVVIRLDRQKTFQTMVGWEATAQAGQPPDGAADAAGGFAAYKDKLLDLAVEDLGISRLRVEIRDAADGSDFDLSPLDNKMRHIALPMRRRLEDRGQKLWINVCVVGNGLRNAPDRYAAQTLAAYQHFQKTYGLVPDSWEMSLEPDNSWKTAPWDPMMLGKAIAATGKLLQANGFKPDIVAPSCADQSKAIVYFDRIVQVQGASDYLKEFSYHLYGNVSDDNRRAIAARARQYHLRTAQLEHIGSGYEDLHKDLVLADNSAWQQYTLCFPTKDDGAQYFLPADGGVSLASRTRFLRQYFRFIRPGDVRIDASSTSGDLEPVAFVHPDGRCVLIVKANRRGDMEIGGLPAGVYGTMTTLSAAAGQWGVEGPQQTVAADGLLKASIAGRGVITIYARPPTQPSGHSESVKGP